MTAAIGFPMPKSIVVDEASATETYAKFIAAPFQRGFGHTLGVWVPGGTCRLIKP